MKSTAKYAAICSLLLGACSAPGAWHESSWAADAQGGNVSVSVTGTTYSVSHADVRLLDVAQRLDAIGRITYGGSYPGLDASRFFGRRTLGEVEEKRRLYVYCSGGGPFLAISSPDITEMLNATNEPPVLWLGMTNSAAWFPNIPTNFFYYTPARPYWGQASGAYWKSGGVITSTVSIPVWGDATTNAVLHMTYRGGLDSIAYRDGVVSRFSRWVSQTNALGDPLEYTVKGWNVSYTYSADGGFHTPVETNTLFEQASASPAAQYTYTDLQHTALVTYAESQGTYGFKLENGDEYIQAPLARYGLLGVREILEIMKYTQTADVYWLGTNVTGSGESQDSMTAARQDAVNNAEWTRYDLEPRADPTVEWSTPRYDEGGFGTNVIGSNYFANFSIRRGRPFVAGPTGVVGTAYVHLKAGSVGTNEFDACGTGLSTSWQMQQSFPVNSTNATEIVPAIPWGGGRGFQINGERAVIDWTL